MPPSDNGKSILDEYLISLDQNDEATTTVIIVGGRGDEESDTGITYLVDEEGRYSYQPSGINQDIMTLPAEVNQGDEKIGEEAEVLVDGDGYQTVTLMPSESSNAELSYSLVMQDVNKPVTNINLSEERSNDDLYKFDLTEGNWGVKDSDEKFTKINSSKRAKFVSTRFNCHFCAYTSQKRYLLLRHIKSHSEDRPHKCNICDRGFKTLTTLQNHVNMHNGIKRHICKYCERPFTTSGELIRHVRYCHTHEKPHKCTECAYASVELSKLQRHMRCHTGERPYQCQHCSYSSQDNFKLKRHLRTHTGEKPYKCEKCSMCFTQSNSLKVHKLIHNVAEKPLFACEQCPVKCVRKTNLRIHVQKLHTSDKPHKCKICGKTFPDKYSCKMHNKTHDGEKCFKCEICPYVSTTPRHLKSHLIKHTNEKPFVCDLCDTSFRQKQLLRRHQNLYHNPNYEAKPPKENTYNCHECRRTFARKGNLIRHLSIHDPNARHQRALALKLERQKKIKINKIRIEDTDNDGGMVKFDSIRNEQKRGEVITVADGESQEYVVLEVIQFEDDSTQQVAVIAPKFIERERKEEKAGKEIEDEEMEQDIYMQQGASTSRS